MAAPTFFSNRPPFHHQRHRNTTVSPPPDLPPLHHNFTFSDTTSTNNHHFLTFNNGPINYPNLASSYNPPISHQSPPLPHLSRSHFAFSDNEFYSNPTFVPNDNGDLLLNNPIQPMQLSDCYSYHDQCFMEQKPPSLSEIYNDGGCFPVCSMEHELQPELPPLTGICNDGDFSVACSMEQELQAKLPPMPEIYIGGGDGSYCMEQELKAELPRLPEIYDGGGGFCAVINPYREGLGFRVEERRVQMKERLSAQSMAARVRRRKISEKTSELGKLVPGGQKMTTAEMFQAAYKYIKFLQAQVSVLQCMSSSPGLGSELQTLLTCPSVQEKLYTAGKCIVSQTLGEALADDHQQANVK